MLYSIKEAMIRMISKACPQCGQSFEAEYKQRKFCSRKCAHEAMSRKIEITCPYCKKIVRVHRGTKFCSKQCADSARRGIRISPIVMKVCPVCGNSFESKEKIQKFCSTRCADKGKYKPPTHNLTEAGRKVQSDKFKQQWQDEEFRKMVVDRMKFHNPSYMPGVVEKANATRAKNGKMHNNFKYGNGKISPYEQLVEDKLEGLGFVYNYAITTKPAREADPDANYAHNYKPDFVNLETKLCIEVDGYGHSTPSEKQIDAKKEKCLNILGYTVIRFTHEDIDKGVFDQWLNSYQENM